MNLKTMNLKNIIKDQQTRLPEDANFNMIVAGTSGSGKSYVIRKMIERLVNIPNVRLVLIDPKTVELEQFRNHLRTKWYADSDEDILNTLNKVYSLMWDRYRDMKADGLTVTKEDHVVVFVDEMYFLMESDYKKMYIKMFTRLMVMGRAAHIHLVLCTQTANRNVIPAGIRDNAPTIVCLNQQDETRYRYLLGKSYPELPVRGYAYVRTPAIRTPRKVRSDEVWDAIIDRPDAVTGA